MITIVGSGNMAKALISPLKDGYDLEVIARDTSVLSELKLKYPVITTTKIDGKIDIDGKDIILSTKQQALESLQFKGVANVLYSVLAGTTIDILRQNIKAKNYIRVMPNVSAKYQKSMTTLTGDMAAQNDAVKLFDNIGQTVWVDSEDKLDIATAIAGSGPAYLAIVAQGLIDGGVNCGLSRAQSRQIVAGLFDGFSPLIAQTLPQDIKDEATSPNGTTVAGCEVMERYSIQECMSQTVATAYERAKAIKDENKNKQTKDKI
ncbi:MAG: pyrroline-5-carboxylate reductase [Epsilonproteobacteria bacterium]|nr:MAG: pyrroline-5-carboxylate reductase [Campylobacterota bacterium]